MKYYFDATEFPFNGDFKMSTATWPMKLSHRLFCCAALPKMGFTWWQTAHKALSAHGIWLFCLRFRK
jgi:hypothetical protein